MAIFLWAVAVLLILAGLAGTVLPVLPGPILIYAGIVLAAWADDFTRIGGWSLALTGLLTVVSLACDYLAAVLGARRHGASPYAVVGAAIGTVLGLFTGLWGLFLLPLLGAAAGELLIVRDLRRAGRVGYATAIGLVVGLAVSIAIAFTMVGIFIVALVI